MSAHLCLLALRKNFNLPDDWSSIDIYDLNYCYAYISYVLLPILF